MFPVCDSCVRQIVYCKRASDPVNVRCLQRSCQPDHIESHRCVPEDRVAANEMLCRYYDFALFGPRNRCDRAAERHSGPIANLNDDQQLGVAHDEVEFAVAASVVRCKDSQSALGQEALR